MDRRIRCFLVRILFNGMVECLISLLAKQNIDPVEVFLRSHIVGSTFDARRDGRDSRSSLMGPFVIDLGSIHQSVRSMFIPGKQ